VLEEKTHGTGEYTMVHEYQRSAPSRERSRGAHWEHRRGALASGDAFPRQTTTRPLPTPIAVYKVGTKASDLIPDSSFYSWQAVTAWEASKKSDTETESGHKPKDMLCG